MVALFFHSKPRRDRTMSGMVTKKAGVQSICLLSFLSLLSSVEAKTLVVTSTRNDGPGSLRQALIHANESGDPATIAFALGSGETGHDCRSGSWSIQLTEELPVIKVRVVIDGYTQPGSCKNRAAIDQENNAHIAVALCCGAADNASSDEGCPEVGLTFGPGSDCSKVRGLAINGFEHGIEVQANNVDINGMFLGVDVDGITSHANTTSILIDSDATGTTIGGCKPKHRNLIGGSSQGEGVKDTSNSQLLGAITNRGDRTTIQGTTINLTRKGYAVITSEAQRGIVSLGNDGMLVGGPLTGYRVVIAGNYDANIHLDSTSNDRLQNVFAGLALDGKHMLGGGVGLRILNNDGEPASPALEQGYTHAIVHSVFSGNSQSGIVLGSEYSDYPIGKTLIRKTYMGTSLTGDSEAPNGEHGLAVLAGSHTDVQDSVLCYNQGNGLYNVLGRTVLDTANTSFNGLGGVRIWSPEESNAADDQFAFQLKRTIGGGNGGNTVATRHLAIDEIY
jgi:hypothetical protein